MSLLTIEEIRERVTAVAEHLCDEKVRLPGEGAHQREITARAQGLEIPDHVVASLGRLATDLNVEIPTEFADGMSASPDSHENLKSWSRKKSTARTVPSVRSATNPISVVRHSDTAPPHETIAV